MRALLLTAQTDAVLAFIRRTEFPLSVYGRSAARVWPMVREQVNRRLSRFGVPVHGINIYRRYATEMLKAFRAETGEPPAAARAGRAGAEARSRTQVQAQEDLRRDA
ncbi:MAG: hypothetical protein NTX53_02870 [candidate division WOR-3 bacterium]|nr:hypothetical protein [candidate division WOR-3 bacterium]